MLSSVRTVRYGGPACGSLSSSGHGYGGLGYAVDARLGSVGAGGVGGVTPAPGTHEVDVVERPYGFATDRQLAGSFLHCVTIAQWSVWSHASITCSGLGSVHRGVDFFFLQPRSAVATAAIVVVQAAAPESAAAGHCALFESSPPTARVRSMSASTRRVWLRSTSLREVFFIASQ